MCFEIVFCYCVISSDWQVQIRGTQEWCWIWKVSILIKQIMYFIVEPIGDISTPFLKMCSLCVLLWLYSVWNRLICIFIMWRKWESRWRFVIIAVCQKDDIKPSRLDFIVLGRKEKHLEIWKVIIFECVSGPFSLKLQMRSLILVEDEFIVCEHSVWRRKCSDS